MLLAASLVIVFAHSIDLNLNLTSCGFLFDIADLLLIVDTLPWHSYPKTVPRNGKDHSQLLFEPGFYSSPGLSLSLASIQTNIVLFTWGIKIPSITPTIHFEPSKEENLPTKNKWAEFMYVNTKVSCTRRFQCTQTYYCSSYSNNTHHFHNWGGPWGEKLNSLQSHVIHLLWGFVAQSKLTAGDDLQTQEGGSVLEQVEVDGLVRTYIRTYVCTHTEYM